MKDIAIFGAGGFGREVACLIKIINGVKLEWNFLGFFDDGKAIGETNDYGKVLGGINELNKWDKPISIVISIGTPKIIEKIVSKISNDNVEFPNLISPDVTILDSSNYIIGKGNILSNRCLVSCNVAIGDFNVFNQSATIGHDVSIGNFNVVMPAARISGAAKIGYRNLIGANAFLMQLIEVGSDTTIGANSAVFANTKDDHSYIGNPARGLKM